MALPKCLLQEKIPFQGIGSYSILAGRGAETWIFYRQWSLTYPKHPGYRSNFVLRIQKMKDRILSLALARKWRHCRFACKYPPCSPTSYWQSLSLCCLNLWVFSLVFQADVCPMCSIHHPQCCGIQRHPLKIIENSGLPWILENYFSTLLELIATCLFCYITIVMQGVKEKNLFLDVKHF